jgi:hypothetical protein
MLAAAYLQKDFFSHCNEDYYIIVSENVRDHYMNGKLIRRTLLPQNKEIKSGCKKIFRNYFSVQNSK